jgi:hypothetical protein
MRQLVSEVDCLINLITGCSELRTVRFEPMIWVTTTDFERLSANMGE